MNRECCFGCGFTGTARAVRAHICRRHPLLTGAKRVGRPQRHVCDLCGLHHDHIAGPGRALRRRYLVRRHTATVVGAVPPGERALLAALNLPPGVKRISRIEFAYENCRGPFRGVPDDQGRRDCAICGRWHDDGSQYQPVATYEERTPTGAKSWIVLRGPGGKESRMRFELDAGKGGDPTVSGKPVAVTDAADRAGQPRG